MLIILNVGTNDMVVGSRFCSSKVVILVGTIVYFLFMENLNLIICPHNEGEEKLDAHKTFEFILNMMYLLRFSFDMWVH